ncbi:ABC transporter ATP-binding protein [Mediterraneibacter glycyrrhizinilyticus]|uniref:ATP-binding cassette domain-containing protein n=1 Tax=Mediterraneibacter glycyrrhizinilyticus TaxID=342942 RepID=UPI001960CF32|nr:ATP-binding cassette domain-containing protein [Mediterraneibacter glycyrrhizinilyticus]MBM6750421.1 ABC transporter ATP-binding protein [Mediterraneibacter glycyrrhizinilyticus]
MEKMIRISGLEKAYGEHRVLEALSMTMPSGETSCIMGPSGCGKTTLLRILMGLEKADGGVIEGIPEKKSVVFQEDRLCDDLSGKTNIRLVCPKKDPSLIEEGMENLGLGESMDRPVREYSGGMRQRTAILRALFADWDILFLDEPLKGLDEKIKKVTAEYIRSRVRGKTVLCVTHDPGDVDLLGASRVIEMK